MGFILIEEKSNKNPNYKKNFKKSLEGEGEWPKEGRKVSLKEAIVPDAKKI